MKINENYINNSPSETVNQVKKEPESEAKTVDLDEVKRIELIRKVQNGDEKARVEMLKMNSGLVFSITKDYFSILSTSPAVSIDDLMQEARIGLLKAIDTFDESKNTRFSTHAYSWVRSQVQRFVQNNLKQLRVPVYLQADISKYKKIYNKKIQEFNIEPTSEEIAKELDLSVDKIELIKVLMSQQEISTESNLGNKNKEEEDGNNSKIEEFMASSEDRSIEQDLDNVEIINILKKNLTEKEFDIFSLSYGLDHRGKFAGQEIADVYGVSRQRIDQINKKTAKKIQELKEIDKIREILGK